MYVIKISKKDHFKMLLNELYILKGKRIEFVFSIDFE